VQTTVGKRILIVEDEPHYAALLQTQLERRGYEVLVASDGHEALHCVEESTPDLIILDIELGDPNLNGIDVCKRIRGQGNRTPIIFLTDKRKDVRDLELGFDVGADDYLRKDLISERELAARIRSKLPPQVIVIDDYMQIGIPQRAVSILREGQWQDVHLTPKEFDLLKVLVENAGIPLGKTTLLERVFDYPDDIETETVRRHIATLRRKLEPNPGEPRYILNVFGIGYKFRDFR